ncbi:MAG: ChaB family protein [Phycisphaerales bacterium]|nr:ChaB family protein [Phycisphaerales bacterium]
MPYLTNADLPDRIRFRLPEHAQDIYRKAFNNAWDRYVEREPHRREEIAYRVAWSAVNNKYQKINDPWVAREYLQSVFDAH